MRRHPASLFATLTAAIFATVMVVTCDVYADEQPLRFTDPEDGQLDMSDFLLKHKGALPVPIVITEPAVGYGFGLGLLFFPAP